MKLEQQVCSLELAKRLKELGMKQESHFCWYGGARGVSGGYNIAEYAEYYEGKFAAFTVAELGEILPKDIWFQGVRFACAFDTFQDDWVVGYYYDGRTPSGIDKNYQVETRCEAHTEADARAKILVCLLENKLITLP